MAKNNVHETKSRDQRSRTSPYKQVHNPRVVGFVIALSMYPKDGCNTQLEHLLIHRNTTALDVPVLSSPPVVHRFDSSLDSNRATRTEITLKTSVSWTMWINYKVIKDCRWWNVWLMDVRIGRLPRPIRCDTASFNDEWERNRSRSICFQEMIDLVEHHWFRQMGGEEISFEVRQTLSTHHWRNVLSYLLREENETSWVTLRLLCLYSLVNSLDCDLFSERFVDDVNRNCRQWCCRHLHSWFK